MQCGKNNKRCVYVCGKDFEIWGIKFHNTTASGMKRPSVLTHCDVKVVEREARGPFPQNSYELLNLTCTFPLHDLSQNWNWEDTVALSL